MPAHALLKYSEYRPTRFDTRGLGCDDRQDWLVAPCAQTRDSDCLESSNFATLDHALTEVDPSGDDHETHRFGHWGPGWIEIILVRPGSKAAGVAQECADALVDYPVLDDDDFSERETEEANHVWADCYSVKERIAYIREHQNQFEAHSLADLLSCVRGRYFLGYASDLIS